MVNKTCTNSWCAEINPQPITNFYKSKAKGIHDSWCKICFKLRVSKRRAERNKANPEVAKQKRQARRGKSRDEQLRHKYGITLYQYNARLHIQDHKCAICFKHKSEFKDGLVVDHCHKTNKVRGLLCPKCNAGLGFFKDNTLTITAAIKYLELNNA